MPFSTTVKEEALVCSRRRCCLCQKFVGRNIEVHHIIPEADDGPSTLENAIPLCYDCHADVGHYNPQHPRGNKYSPNELRKHRDYWWNWCNDNPFVPLPDDPILASPQIIDLRTGKWKAHSRLKIHNRTSEVYYQVQTRLAIDVQNIVLANISIKARESKEEIPVNIGAYTVYDDIMGIGGPNKTGNRVIFLRIAALDPGETRTFAITNNNSPMLPQPKATISVCRFSLEHGGVLEDSVERGVGISFQTCEDIIKVEYILTPRTEPNQ